MPDNNNSASRLLKVLRKAAMQNPGVSAPLAWASAFGIPTDRRDHQFRVAERIEALQVEVGAIRKGMHDGKYGSHLYEGPLQNVEQVLSLHLIAHSWGSSVAHLGEKETLYPLAFCAEILPNEEDVISIEDLKSIDDLLEQLEQSLAASDLPQALQDLIVRHTALIRDALLTYAISGAKALRQVIRAAAGDLIEAREIIKEHQESPAVKTLGKVWERVDKVSSAVIKADKMGQIVTVAAGWISKLLQ